MPSRPAIRAVEATLYFLPVTTRMPLKFGRETVEAVTVARCRVRVADRQGRTADGWGETPLSVTWVWPSALPYAARHEALCAFCGRLAGAWASFSASGHPLEVGHDFQVHVLPRLWQEANAARPGAEPMPWLAALVCCSLFDLALHDAYGVLLQRPVYTTYTAEFLARDLAHYLEPAAGSGVTFAGRYPTDFLVAAPPALRAWHLVGGKDPVTPAELTGHEPADGYPVLLADWIRRDGLTCLKLKLTGLDLAADLARTRTVGAIALTEGVDWLSLDFNCTVTDPRYVVDFLDQLCAEQPRLYGMILYVEQPFPYELEEHPLAVHAVSARKPLFMDESAHDWRLVARGRQLGWTGVALKTCKTQTGALLSLCWAKAHGMTLMVQDLTNPMLAQLPHLLLAGHAGTIMGVETNAPQFYPEASAPEAAAHPGCYRRRGGLVELPAAGPGFGYGSAVGARSLPPPAAG